VGKHIQISIYQNINVHLHRASVNAVLFLYHMQMNILETKWGSVSCPRKCDHVECGSKGSNQIPIGCKLLYWATKVAIAQEEAVFVSAPSNHPPFIHIRILWEWCLLRCENANISCNGLLMRAVLYGMPLWVIFNDKNKLPIWLSQ